jgi:hypothetical protein
VVRYEAACPSGRLVAGAFDAFLVVQETPVTEPTKTRTWEDLLDEAAKGCDVEVDAFVRGAWAAYLDARPGMRERLEEQQLRAQLDELRKHGQIAQA